MSGNEASTTNENPSVVQSISKYASQGMDLIKTFNNDPDETKAIIKNLYTQIFNDREAFVSKFLWIVIIVFISILCNYYLNTIGNMQVRECKFMKTIYSKVDGNLRSINEKDTNCGYNLRDYYIKTAYNCCSGGNYVNGFVSLCALQCVIKEGVRCFDMELYNIGGNPVVATSISESYDIKGTYNSLDFADVMNVIVGYGFGGISHCPNPTDPIILHLRIKSSNKDFFNSLANVLEAYDSYLLDNSYSYENYGQNLGAVPLLSLRGQIIIIVDRDNTVFINTPFNEYVNLASNSAFMSALHYFDIANAPSYTDLQTSNKTGMTIAMPDIGKDPENPNGIVCRQAGCQMLAMRYQKVDKHLEENSLFFDTNGYAFILKPASLRYVPTTVTVTPQDPVYSYETKEATFLNGALTLPV